MTTARQEVNKVLRRIKKHSPGQGLCHTLPTPHAKTVVALLQEKGFTARAKHLWWNRLWKNPYTHLEVIK